MQKIILLKNISREISSLLYCRHHCFRDSKDYFDYQFWFKLAGSFFKLNLLILREDFSRNIRLLFPWFILLLKWSLHKSFEKKNCHVLRVTLHLRQVLQETILRSGNEYFPKTLEAHISRIKNFFINFLINIFKIFRF